MRKWAKLFLHYEFINFYFNLQNLKFPSLYLKLDVVADILLLQLFSKIDLDSDLKLIVYALMIAKFSLQSESNFTKVLFVQHLALF